VKGRSNSGRKCIVPDGGATSTYEKRSYMPHSALLQVQCAMVARLHRVNSAKRSLRPNRVL